MFYPNQSRNDRKNDRERICEVFLLPLDVFVEIHAKHLFIFLQILRYLQSEK